MTMIFFSAASLVSAFLLFQMQPMMGKFLLPWFGGTPLVWTICMMFFQAILLMGYVYAHLLSTQMTHRLALVVHSGVLVLGAVCARFLPDETYAPSGEGSPLIQLVWILTVHVGVPFFALSATSPLIQNWFYRRSPHRSPYPLYAVSNVGSLAAVLTYPFVFEPMLCLKSQETVFRIVYLFFVGGTALSMALSLRRSVPQIKMETSAPREDEPPASAVSRWSWIFLSALGVMLLLSSTEQISRNVAVTSLFWMTPLCLYLLSFIICFRKNGAGVSPLWSYLLIGAVVLVCVQLFAGNTWPVWMQSAVYFTTLFIGCMICHGTLHRLRPTAERLTAYYLYISLGGVLGGIFVGVIAPLLFSDMWEYSLTWAGVSVFAFVRMLRESDIAFLSAKKKQVPVALSIASIIAVLCLFSDVLINRRDAAVSVRSFFGRLAIYKSKKYTCLYHGIIRHGCQWRDPAEALMPTTYFGPDSGVGVSVRALRMRQEGADNPSLHIGVVGLGIGTCAAWGKTGDRIRFYEIDEKVKELAEQYFTFLSRSEASVDVVLGDARLSLHREDTASDMPLYDLLVVDAFSGDAIPLHLLTKEAGALYWRRLKKDGVLAVHISNRFLDLEPVLFGLADALGKTALLMDTEDVMARLIYGSTWVVMTGDAAVIKYTRALANVHPRPEKAPVLFTDQFSNLLDLM